MREDWRMAFMFDAREGQFERMENNLARAADEIRQLAKEAHVRIGVADRHTDVSSEYDIEGSRGVDGAVEISVTAARKTELPAIAESLHKVLLGIAEPLSLEVMAGPFYPMVPVRDGATFLSLAFRRDPATTSQQFQTWWHDQHANVAIPVLGPGLLAYDQVHVDAQETHTLARRLGIASATYDAYDNLTWADRYEYLKSISNPEDMARVLRDEVGRIDNNSRRSALMRTLG